MESDGDVMDINPTGELSPPIFEIRPQSGDMVSMSGTLKRGLKMKDPSDTISLSGALKKGFRKHAGKGNDANFVASPDSQSPRSSKRFSFKSPKKSKRGNGYNDDTMSITSRSTRDFRFYRDSTLRVDDVVPYSSPFDDTASMIEGLLVDTVPIRQEEGIRDTIGRKNVVTLKKMIKLEKPQGNRSDPKVLVLTPYRSQILGVKAPFKMEADFHFLDIKSMDSPSPERLVISTHNGKIYFMLMIGTDDADHIIGRVTLSLRTIFPNVALSRILKASLEPLSRQKVIQTMLNQADQVEPGPCGNFSDMYRCVCDYLSCPVHEDVEWDVDTIYLSQNCHEINFKDFDLPETKDIIPVLACMIYNRWFEGLVIRNTKLSTDVVEYVLKVARSSHNLKELTLEGVGVKGDFAIQLANYLVKNKESCLEILDLSNNPLEDKGLIHLSGSLPVVKKGSLRKLNISRTGLSAKGVNGLCQSLRSSQNIMRSLTHLNLSGNCIRGDEAEGLYNFLASENHITDLDLSATEGAVEVYVSALAKGCTTHLENVSLSKNHFHSKKNKENLQPSSFQEFFRDTSALKMIDFSSMKFPPEALRHVMDGLLSNSTTGLAVALNLSSCELKLSGCQVLQSAVASSCNIVKLDLTDNSLDMEIPTLLEWIQRNKSLKELLIGKNFFNIKPKHMKQVMESIVELVQEEESCLECLSLAESKIRDHVTTFLGCLGSNTSLTSLDISGNFMGDAGSRVLGKALQINSKLRILKLDRNNLSAAGFHEIANSLEKNFTLRYMPYPVNDAVAAMKGHPERTQNALARIQDLLLRNANSNHAINDQQFRVQSVMTNTAHQVLDKVAEKVDDLVNALDILEADSAGSVSVIEAKELVKDAKNSKLLLSDIYGLGMAKSSGEQSQLQSKINEMATSMDDMVNQHVMATVEAMNRNTESQCPHIYEEIKDELASTIEDKCQLAPDYIRDHVISSSGTEIVNKVSELNLAIATIISDKVNDTLLAALSHCNVTLTEQLNKHKNQRELGASLAAPGVAESPPIDEGVIDVDSRPDSVAIVVEKPPRDGDLLPNMRKERAASVAKRRQRPSAIPSPDVTEKKSSRLGELPPSPAFPVEEKMKEEEEIKETRKEEAPKITKENKKEKKLLMETGSSDLTGGIAQLPEPKDEKTLEHVTKSRPKGPPRRTRRAPTRGKRVEKKSEDVDDFFTNNVSNTDFTSTPTIEEEAEIKEKEKREEKKNPKTGPGMPLITPDMLKSKKKPDERKQEEDQEEEEAAPKEEEEAKSPMKKPKGAMVMPGMGFGGNLLAEMKLKKLGKKSESDDGKAEDPKAGGISPFGPSMLRKTPDSSPRHESPNENNSNNSGTSPSKPSLFSRLKGKSGHDKKEGEKAEAKGKALMPPSKHGSAKGKPPPLPTKPKPSLLKSGHETNTRPMSEFLEADHAASSLVRTRAASWGKTSHTNQSEKGN
ncbi:unnamed protein product [Clavelina lepadiformis]|uniref:Uncharacterized protein n=1 Tax=Clavelina lepadiformis TaxID=159417 RepID=A0ABP0FUX0_CLALP